MPAVLFAAGIAVSAAPFWAFAVTAVLWIVAGRLRWLPAFLFCFLLGGLLSSWRQPGPDPELDVEAGEVAIVSGCVAGPPTSDDVQLRFLLELEHHARARVTLTTRPGEMTPTVAYGDIVEVEAKIRKPRNYGNPGAFDFVNYLRRDSVFWLASARGVSKLRRLEGTCGSPLRRPVLELRAWLIQRIRKLTNNDKLMPALLVGDNSFLEREDTAEFRRTGTYHAIVVSGLHITVVAGTVLLLLRFAGLPLGFVIAIGAGLAWLYAGVADSQAPVVRSALGFSLFLAASWFYRRGRLLNLLGLTAILLLVADPSAVYDPSFQLTFLSVAAIGALATPLIDRTFGPCRDASGDSGQQFRTELKLVSETLRIPMGAIDLVLRFGFGVLEMIVISLCVQLALVLPGLVYFHQLSATAVLANVLAVPLLSAAVPVGLLAALTGSVSLASAATLLTGAATTLVRMFDRVEPGLRLPAIPLSVQAALLLSAGLLGAALLFRARWPVLVASGALALGSALVAVRWDPGTPRGNLELTAIDVGQGDSLLVVFPDGRTLLVDAGGFPVFDKRLHARFDTGEDVVSPYLWQRGLRRLDYVAVTHLHDDHAAGMPAVIRNFRPREVWTGLANENNPLLGKLRDASRAVGSAVHPLYKGDTRPNVQVLWPRIDDVPGPTARNDDSLVLLLTHGRHRFLLMGDAEKRTEMSMDVPEEVDVLKAGHHGSRTSSQPEFLAITRPLFALMGVGAQNFYRHPSPEVIQRFHDTGTRVLRTDEDGLVQVKSDGKRLRIWRYRDDSGASTTPATQPGLID